ncbi:MAG: hypothetical protein H0W72_15015, partial [Planctomycetes bacterium]|nr:hypothetical protein [Planctomycetota bacterium]
MTHQPIRLATLLALALCAGAAESELITVSTGAQPKLAYAVERQGDKLNVTVEVAAFAADGSGVEPTLGVAARKQQILTAKAAKATRGANLARFAWSVPATALIDKPADWKDLRLAIDVRWSGGAGGGDRRHERYRHLDGREPSAGLSTKAADWAPLDLDDLAQRLADRRDRMLIKVKQPIDGKYSVVVEDAAGRRVRNLAGGLPAAKGEVAVEWDGCDEDGRMVAEGSYRWRSIHHPGLAPEYVMSFANADEPTFHPLLSNHCHFTAAAANDTLAVLAAVGTEGGYAMAAFDREGRWKQGYNGVLGAGWNAIAVALDDTFLYAAQDGEGWGSSIDRSKPDWQGEVALTLTRFDLAGGGVVDYPGGKRWRELERHPWGPGAGPAQLREQMSLTGMARIGARLYIGSRAAEALLVVDVASGEFVDRIPLPKPGPIAASGDRLVALSAGIPMLIDVAAKTAKPLYAAPAAKAAGIDALDIRAIALAADGRLFLADARSHSVRIVDAAGKATTLGTPGGPVAGPWQAERMATPSGLALLGERLWVAEDRTSPKRAVAWDLAKRSVVRQIFGNPA